MTSIPIAAKLKLKAGQKTLVVAAPSGYQKELSPLLEGVQLSDHLDGDFVWLQVLIKNGRRSGCVLSARVKNENHSDKGFMPE
jgi:hypothetical protein